MGERNDTLTSIIVIHCHDNTRRRIKVIGLWNSASATTLGKDLEKGNFKYATVGIG